MRTSDVLAVGFLKSAARWRERRESASMRLASFNVENLFARAKVLNTATWAEGRPQLAAFERFNRTAQRAYYRDADKQDMIDDLLTLGVLTHSGDKVIRQPNRRAQAALLRENRGDFMVERK